jgi:hypothetical protein
VPRLSIQASTASDDTTRPAAPDARASAICSASQAIRRRLAASVSGRGVSPASRFVVAMVHKLVSPAAGDQSFQSMNAGTENHTHSVAIHTMRYNFVRIHQTPRCTPAMAACVTAKLWELLDMVRVLEDWE